MRTFFLLCGVALTATAICVATDERPPVSVSTDREVAPGGDPGTAPEDADLVKTVQTTIRQSAESFVQAYQNGDAKQSAEHFAPDAEYMDETGDLLHGRVEIEQSLSEHFAAHTGCQLTLTIDMVRIVSPGVALVNGQSSLTLPNSQDSQDCQFDAVYVQTGEAWLLASLKTHSSRPRRAHRSELQQLSWLNGEWIDEGDECLVTFNCSETDQGHFLLRTFAIQIAGEKVMEGTQRIGWDPLTRRLRTWIFDSEGGYGEGLWHQDGENWILKITGVTADGEAASSTCIYTPVDEKTMTWQSVDHEIGGVRQTDSEVITIVRQAPVPSPTVPKVAGDQ